ncbi:MAG: heavy metal translocating P-type ATPase [Eubacteriales bacterium]|nr:heavy metal translocating P-type ATPase [Eubacteriales bacterium]
MTKKQKKNLYRIILAAVCYLGAVFLPLEGAAQFAVYLVCYGIIGWDIVWKAVTNILHGQVFDENFLMTVATIGAMCLGEYSEGVAVMLFYQVGELFQSYAVSKSRRSIAGLMDIRPDYAMVVREGKVVQADPEEVAVGEVIVVKPGERIPLDGIILEGNTTLDTSALTGESVPRDAEPGAEVISGCINQSGTIRMSVSKEYGESTVARILELVENASSKKSKSENFITRFAKYYTPAVVIAAAVLAVLPPLVLGGGFAMWIQRALTFLVISCPCALVISVPLSFFGGIGGASKCGVLIKGSNYLEALASTETVVFDKTGTLTKGAFAVTGIYPQEISTEELLELAAYAEQDSSHPIARSIQKAFGKETDTRRIGSVQEIAGQGLSVELDGRTILAGNERLMKRFKVSYKPVEETGTVVYVAKDGKYMGALLIEDEIKEDAAQAVHALKACGIKKTVMLTGDSPKVAEKVGQALGLDEIHAGLLPADKVARMEALMKRTSNKGKLAFVGDGINDAPVLARADIGIAMGGLGSDAAIEAADIVIMTDEPSKIAAAIAISEKTLRIVHQNIVFALGVKAVVLLLGALGFASMWAAVFADVGVSVIAILNAIRALQVKRFQKQSVQDEEATVAFS